jgi:hypothetical protein
MSTIGSGSGDNNNNEVMQKPSLSSEDEDGLGNMKRSSCSTKDEPTLKASTTTNKRIKTNQSETIFDGAYIYGFNAGDRLLVRWEIIVNEGQDDERHVEKWWGATLLEYDGRTYTENEDDNDRNQETRTGCEDDSGPVAIRVLEYDEDPESGFNEKTREDVVFATASELLDINSQELLPYKREGEEFMIDVFTRDSVGGFEDLVNNVLTKAMKKSIPNFDALPAAVQLSVAEKISVKKEKLIRLMEEFFTKSGKRVGTSEDMKALIAQTMKEN